MALSGTRRLKMALLSGDIVKMALSSKKRRSRSCPSAKRPKLEEPGSDSFVATEELSQTCCDKSVSDESYESDSSVSDDDFSDDETDSVVKTS